MSFAFPLALLLLPLPLLVWRLLAVRAPEAAALRVPADVLGAATPARGRDDRVGLALMVASWAALVLALAGPRVPAVKNVVTASGREIVLALDLSGSMVNEDFVLDGKPLSRLDAVKRVASRFVAARRGDRIGLVIFGDQAYVAQPPTFDVESVAYAINAAQIGVSGRSTAISDGLGLATRRLMQSDAKSKVVVLLSDGLDTSSKVQAIDAARLAATHGVRIHTIALGPDDLENQPESRDAVDAAALDAMARAGHGTSFRVRSMEDLEAMAASLDALEPNPMNRPPLSYWRPLWIWPAGVAMAAALLLALRRQA
ncbi:VWA domain-containing protein [Ancylobacter sp. MQZ15Z-1]|uniref:VWA domain-containing protein n=1 Tax=Ancylobacter mangrovi TaxID=2972472 RepID=A0A9X2PB92_9HYPH|nr:VWA domain-containing protein [Ancylobacter mangrovi]MCS0495612.1 VWA domain-containing protein [Ancylobacter mangrovi]